MRLWRSLMQYRLEVESCSRGGRQGGRIGEGGGQGGSCDGRRGPGGGEDDDLVSGAPGCVLLNAQGPEVKPGGGKEGREGTERGEKRLKWCVVGWADIHIRFCMASSCFGASRGREKLLSGGGQVRGRRATTAT